MLFCRLKNTKQLYRMMIKKILLLLILTGLFACNKKTEPELMGNWKLENISGGFSGNGYNAEFDYLNITDEKHCEWLDSLNNPLATGTYQLSASKGKECIEFNIKNKLETFYFDLDLEYIFYSHDTLYMRPCFECNDCFDYFFIKDN